MADEKELVAHLAVAPSGWTSKDILRALFLDPYQMRTSPGPLILLTNPRTRKSYLLSEYVEAVGPIKYLVIETTDGLVPIQWFKASSMGSIFLPAKPVPKSAIKVPVPGGDSFVV